jgi:hypothetical protein
MDIEAQSFRLGESDKPYFAGEYEKRETMRRAIDWVAEIQTQTVIHNKSGNVLQKIHQFVYDLLWDKYHPKVTLDAREANALYTAARNYFLGKAQGGYPTIALIVEVDMLCKPFASMSRTELRAISASEFERMKLIMTAREEALGLVSEAVRSEFSQKQMIEAKKQQQAEFEKMPGWLYPEGVRQQFEQ